MDTLWALGSLVIDHACGCYRRKEKAELRKELKKNSVHPVENPYQNAPTGAVPRWGYFGIVWPELLHQLEAGLMKTGIEAIVLMMEEYGLSFGQYVNSCQMISNYVNYLACMSYFDHLMSNVCQKIVYVVIGLT